MTYEEFEIEWGNDSPYIHAHTSGSTGAPKPITLLKDDMLVSASATNAFFGIGRDSLLAIPLSCDYIAGKMMAVRSYAANCRLKVIPAKNEFDIGCDDIDLISVVPSQVDCLIAHPEWAQKIRAVIVGGAALSPARQKDLAQAGYNAYMSYGMTETCSHVALAAVGESAFIAMPGIEFDIDDRGCLVVNAPMMSVGRVITNDVVTLLDRHRFKWEGRFDNVINSGGIKIFPEKLEGEIAKIINLDFYIVGVPDDKWGQAVQMVVAGDESLKSELEKALKGHLKREFVPKNIRFVRMLPRTDNGKLKRLPYN